MITVRDVGEVKEGEYNFLRTQTLFNKGYMELYLHVCREARLKHDKKDFVCDILTEYNEIGGLNCWCIIQNLCYRFYDFLELSIWVPGGKRQKGYGSKMLSFVAEKYKDQKIALWTNTTDITAKLYKNFTELPFYIYNRDEYVKNKIFVPFDFSKI